MEDLAFWTQAFKLTGRTRAKSMVDRFATTVAADEFILPSDPDDTIGLQRALNFCAGVGNPVTLVLPGRTLNIRSPLVANVPKGLFITGGGADVTVLKATVNIAGPVLLVNGAQLFVIERLTIDADKKANQCLLLDSDSVPLSMGKIQLCEFRRALVEGVCVNNSTVNNFQGDHISFDSCNFSQSQYQLVFNSGKAVENVVSNCRFFGVLGTDPDYNIWCKSGNVRISKATCLNARLFDVRYGAGCLVFIDNFYSESDKLITVDAQGFEEHPAVIRNLVHNVDREWDVIQWGRKCQVLFENSRFGGSINFTDVVAGLLLNCAFRTGFVLTGPAAGLVSSLSSFQHVGTFYEPLTGVFDLAHPFLKGHGYPEGQVIGLTDGQLYTDMDSGAKYSFLGIVGTKIGWV